MKIRGSVPDTIAWLPMMAGLIGGIFAANAVGDGGHLRGQIVFIACLIGGVAFGLYIMAPGDGHE